MTTETNGMDHELLITALAQIVEHPETWDQTVYVNECGTAFCVAGWVAHLKGYSADEIKEMLNPETIAEQLLGLPRYAGSDLFSDHNSLNTVFQISADLVGVDIQVLKDKVAAEVQAS